MFFEDRVEELITFYLDVNIKVLIDLAGNSTLFSLPVAAMLTGYGFISSPSFAEVI